MEQKPEALLKSVEECVEVVAGKLSAEGYSLAQVAGIGITNQRETTVVWDRQTGQALYNAVVWCDARNGVEVHRLHEKVGQDYLRDKCGLPLATYFSATKLSWLLENVPAVAQAMEEERLMFGTVDSWLVWNLTGGLQGGRHLTDVTNASRTMLMNISTLDWDNSLLEFFSLSASILPRIQVRAHPETESDTPSSAHCRPPPRTLAVWPGAPWRG